MSGYYTSPLQATFAPQEQALRGVFGRGGKTAVQRCCAPSECTDGASGVMQTLAAESLFMLAELMSLLTGLLGGDRAGGVAHPGQSRQATGHHTHPASPASAAGPANAAHFPPQVSGAPHGSHRARGTGYYPANNPLEGGFVDRKGHKLNTLQDYLAGRAPYVSAAMDTSVPYGTVVRIPELEKKYGRPILFKVVDTGGAFAGKGNSRIDICVANEKASCDSTINGPLTLDFP